MSMEVVIDSAAVTGYTDCVTKSQRYTIYDVLVKAQGRLWTVQRRYTDFRELHESLRVKFDDVAAEKFPSKARFLPSTKAMKDRRRDAFDRYIQLICGKKPLPAEVATFLDVDKHMPSAAVAGAAHESKGEAGVESTTFFTYVERIEEDTRRRALSSLIFVTGAATVLFAWLLRACSGEGRSIVTLGLQAGSVVACWALLLVQSSLLRKVDVWPSGALSFVLKGIISYAKKADVASPPSTP
mmetsp:Transcript_4510/g.13512  ORF Transcript_4510/g.13512 Transcript_4510/m.13512 type:complete len:241 (-) Transcript_4510:182-904(-)